MIGIFRQKGINFSELAGRLLNHSDSTSVRKREMKAALPLLLQLLPAKYRKIALFREVGSDNPIWEALVDWSANLRELEKEEILKKQFLHCLDQQYVNALRLFYKKEEGIRYKVISQTVENLLVDSYVSLLDMKAYRYPSLSRENKSDAFSLAFGKFIARVRSDGWKLEKSMLKTFFEKIFRDELINTLRQQKTQKNSNTSSIQTEHLELLLKGANTRVDAGMIQEALLKLRITSPFCFDLIDLHHRGFSYKELSGQFKQTAGQLRRQAYVCREELQRIWTILVNN